MTFLFRFVLLISISQFMGSCANSDDAESEDYESTESLSIQDSQSPSSESQSSTTQSSSEEVSPSSNLTQCSSRRQGGDLVHEIMETRPDQFPYVVSIRSSKDEHLCTGTIVGNGVIVTSANCATKPAAYVFLNSTTIAKKRYNIRNNEKFPTFTGPDAFKNVAILYTEVFNVSENLIPTIKLSNFTNGYDLMYFEAIGHGLNADPGDPKVLQYVGLEIREPITDTQLFGLIDCLDTKVPTCFKDIGGPAIAHDELIGVISFGQPQCTKSMTSSYMISKRMVTVVPIFLFRSWLDDKIAKYPEPSAEVVLSARRLETAPHDPFQNNSPKKAAQKKENGNHKDTIRNKNIAGVLKVDCVLVFSILIFFV